MGIDARTVLVWRRALAFVVLADCVSLAWRVNARTDAGQVELFVFAALGVISAIQLDRRPGSWRWPLLGILALGLLLERYRQVYGFYTDNLFQTGAVLAGWLGGRVFGRLVMGLPSFDPRVERLAATGAVAALAATYTCAGLAKVAAMGLGWIDPTWIRLVMLEYGPLDAATSSGLLYSLVLNSPLVALLGAAFALVAELAAPLLVFGPRWRRRAGTALLILHGGLALLTGIVFIEGVAMLVVFTYPWERRLSPPEEDHAGEVPAAAMPRPRLIAAWVLVVVLLGALWWAPIGRRDHRGDVSDASAPSGPIYPSRSCSVSPLQFRKSWVQPFSSRHALHWAS